MVISNPSGDLWSMEFPLFYIAADTALQCGYHKTKQALLHRKRACSVFQGRGGAFFKAAFNRFFFLRFLVFLGFLEFLGTLGILGKPPPSSTAETAAPTKAAPPPGRQRHSLSTPVPWCTRQQRCPTSSCPSRLLSPLWWLHKGSRAGRRAGNRRL